jgi:hypothetical protein
MKNSGGTVTIYNDTTTGITGNIGTEYYRTLLTFDMGFVPPGATVTSMTLYFKTSGYPGIYVYYADFGDYIDTTDWNSQTGLLKNQQSSSSYYRLPFPLSVDRFDSIHMDFIIYGYTHYYYTTYTNGIYLSESVDYYPYISVTYTGGNLGLNYVSNDTTIYTASTPAEIMVYNNTHDAYMVSFDVWDDIDEVDIFSPNIDWIYLSVTPYAVVSEDGRWINLTNIISNMTYRVYYTIEKSVINGVTLTVYNDNTGKGIDITSVSLSYCVGNIYDDWIATNVINGVITAVSNVQYTVRISDWWGNIIDDYTFTYQSGTILAIPIDITDIAFVFSDGNLHKIGITSGAHTLNISDGKASLYGGVVYDLEVYEDNLANGMNMTLPSFSGASDVIYVNLTLKTQLATVYFRYFDATGTHLGEGVEWERYLAYIDGVYQNFPEYYDGYTHETHNITVKDFFGNELYNSTFTINSTEQLVTISINTYSFKVINSQDYDPIKVKIYYENGTTNHQFYLGAKEVNEKYFKAGNYTIQVVYYNDTGISVPIYFYKQITNQSSYINIRGYNDVTEILEDINGVLYYQKIITNYLTPDLVYIAENMPSVPDDAYDESIILIHPYSIIHYTMNGTEYTTSDVFYYSYYTTSKFYTVTLTLNNTGLLSWENVTWFIGFPENRTINYNTVKVYDLNNDVYLTAGLHYDMTLTGIRMNWDWINSTVTRSLRITFYDSNVTDPIGTPILIADSYEIVDYDGEKYYYTTSSWTNSNPSSYNGPINIKLTFDRAQYLVASSIIIVVKGTGEVLDINEFTYSGDTIIIAFVTIGIGDTQGYDVYFNIDYEEAQKISIFTPLVSIYGFNVTPALLMVIGFFVLLLWTFIPKYNPKKLMVLAIYGSVVIVLFSLYYYTSGVV